MKHLSYGALVSLAGAISLTQTAAAQQPLLPHVKVGTVDVGGMTPDEAAKALRVWWEGEKTTKLKVVSPALRGVAPMLKPSEMGIALDDVATIAHIPAIAEGTSNSGELPSYPLVFKTNPAFLAAFERKMAAAIGPNRPARVIYVKGAIVREPEIAGAAIDETKFLASVGQAIQSDHKVLLPVIEGTKKTSDETLGQIKEVVSEYTTHFPTSKRTRCANIKLAAHIIDGTVLMPGEQFSFNGVVGRRTLKAGFQVAGVYINGQHDTGVGGGICQVSTTLYNSALLSNLAIHRRSNHSLPVAYVPLGRDATVDYGNLDLVFENTYPTPIAISSAYAPGRLTFRILGQKQPGLSVKIIQTGSSSSSMVTEHVTDPHLALGKKRVIKPGARFHSVSTQRLVYMDGKLVKKESLGHSRYGGQPRIVAVGAKPPVVIPGTPPSGPGPVDGGHPAAMPLTNTHH